MLNPSLGHVVNYFSRRACYLVLYVTNQCNLRCNNCLYTDQLNQNEIMPLTLEEFEKVSRSLPYLFQLIFTGGEPFLRKDIDLVAQIFYRHSKAMNITIHTNGTYTETIIEKTKKILQDKATRKLRVVVSMDGLKDTHNRLRGSEKSFDHCLRTVEELKKLERQYKNLTCAVDSLVTSENKDQAKEFIDYISREVRPSDFDLILARGKNAGGNGNPPTADEYESIVNHLVRTFRSNQKPTLFARFISAVEETTRRAVIKTCREDRAQAPCLAGKKMIVMYEDGTVAPCEMIHELPRNKHLTREQFFFGNVRGVDGNVQMLTNNAKSQSICKSIKDHNCHCSFECAITASHFFDFKRLLKNISRSYWKNNPALPVVPQTKECHATDSVIR